MALGQPDKPPRPALGRILTLIVKGNLSLIPLSLLACVAVADNIALQDAASGQTIHVKPGDTVEVMLPANPSTGYSWSVVAKPRGLVAEGEPRFEGGGHGGEVGVGGTAILRFRVAGLFKSAFRLAYARSWEKGVPPARVFEVRLVSVKPDEVVYSGRGPVFLRVGQVLVVPITLSGGVPFQPTAELVPDCLRQADSGSSLMSTRPAPGGPVIHRLRFEAVRTGTGELTIDLAPTVEGGAKTRLRKIRVTVRPARRKR